MYQHIVASIDESDNANLALEQAIEIAKLSGATLHLVHIVNLFELALEEYVLADKSKLEALAQEHVVARWDHAFLVYAGDTAVLDFLNGLPDHKTVVLDCIPTAENLAQEAFRILDAVYHDTYGNHLQLERVRLYETPNCWVDATRPGENG